QESASILPRRALAPMANNARLASWPDIPATRQEYRTSAVRASFRPNKRRFVPAIRGREITGYMKQIAILRGIAARMNFQCLAPYKHSLLEGRETHAPPCGPIFYQPAQRTPECSSTPSSPSVW